MDRNYQKGLSLLEVLMAFAILAIVLTPLLRVFGTGLRNASLASDSSQATLRAESVLASASMESRLTPGQTEGDYGDGFWWRRTIRPFTFRNMSKESQNIPVTPYEVIAEVSWRSGSKRKAVRLSTLKLSVRDQTLGTGINTNNANQGKQKP